MIIRNGVVVDGLLAGVLADVLRRAGAAGLFADYSPRAQMDLQRLHDECHQAGRRAIGASDAPSSALRTLTAPPDARAESAPTSAAVPHSSWSTVADVAELLGVSERRILQRIGSGEIPAVKHKGQWRIDPEKIPERKAS